MTQAPAPPRGAGAFLFDMPPGLQGQDGGVENPA